MQRSLALLPLLFVAGCATTPPALQGRFVSMSVENAMLPQAFGENVRWGGLVVGARDVAGQSCVEVAVYPLDASSQKPGGPPWLLPWSKPHFLACGDLVRDSAVTRVAAMVTFTGVVGSPQVLEVAERSCESHPPSTQDHDTHRLNGTYLHTPHKRQDGTCIVAMPMIAVVTDHVWPEASYTQAPPQDPWKAGD